MTPPPDDSLTLPGSRDEQLVRINEFFCGFVPHNRALGLSMIDFGPGTATIRLPYAEHLVGNPETGVLHGGCVTAMLDATCGASVFLKVMRPIPVATLDLRIDYLRPAERGRDVIGRAHCYHLTRNVAFVRAVAYHDNPADPIASAVGTFMLQTAGMSVIDRAAAAASAKDMAESQQNAFDNTFARAGGTEENKP